MRRLALALLVLAACDDKKPAPAPSASTALVLPSATASAAPSASAAALPPPPAVDEAALLALRAKYEAPAKELIAAVKTAVADEKKKQGMGAVKFGRLGLPATKLSKDGSVLQVVVPSSDDLYVGIHPLNALSRAGNGNAAKVPAGENPKVTCPSEYVSEAAADLIFTDGPTVVVVVRTDACKAADAQREAQITRVKTMAGPMRKDILAHVGKVPATCTLPTDAEPDVSDELKKAGVVKARLSCRNAKEMTWKSHGVAERKYDRKTAVRQPAWRPTIPGFTETAFFLIDDSEKGKPFQLTFAGTRADNVEIESEFYLE